MKIVIVEENDLIRTQLKSLLTFYNTFEIVQEFTKIDDVIEYVSTHPVDAVFSNVEVGTAQTSGDGFYLSIYLTQKNPDILMITYSPEEKYAYYAFKNGCTEFFTLPFDSLVMQRVVDRLVYLYELLEFKKISVNRSIMIKTKTGYRLTKMNDILFIERANRKNKMVLVDGSEIILARYTFDEIEKMLDNGCFFRCYQSFIINLSKVSFVKVLNANRSYSLLFDDYDGEVMLSRDKYAEVVSILKNKYAKIIM